MDEEESPFSRVPRPGRYETGNPLTFEGQMEGLGRVSRGMGSRPNLAVRILFVALGLAFVILMFVVPLLAD